MRKTTTITPKSVRIVLFWLTVSLIGSAVIALLVGFAFLDNSLYGVTNQDFARIPSVVGAEHSDYQAEIEQARRFVKKVMVDANMPSVSVAVGIGNELIWSEAFGYADIENRIQVTPQTPYRIHSVSKTFTGTALAKLYEEGKVDLDAPIQKYVPSFPDKGERLTLRHLASHTSGIRHYQNDNEIITTRHYGTISETLTVFADDPLEFVPGTRFGYSSFGYNLIGAAIETIADQSYLAYVHDVILTPIGAEHTGVEDPSLPTPIQYYERMPDGTLERIPAIDLSLKVPSGGLVSTPEDLVIFGNAVLHAKIIKPETRTLLFTSQQINTGEPTNYSLGWELAPPLDPMLHLFMNVAKAVGWYLPASVGFDNTTSHRGGSLGGMSLLMLYPEYDLVVAFVSNANGDLPKDKTILAFPPMVTEPFLNTTTAIDEMRTPAIMGGNPSRWRDNGTARTGKLGCRV